MTDYKDSDTDMREERINALLDGELDDEQAEQLKREAMGDQALARSIIEAYQLQRAMEGMRVEKAPASLRRRLKRIPREQRPAYLQPGWVTAFAVVPLLVIAVALMQQRAPEPSPAPSQPREPTAAEVAQARQDLAVAFAYIDRVGERAGNEIELELAGEMTDAVAGSVFRTIQHQKIL